MSIPKSVLLLTLAGAVPVFAGTITANGAGALPGTAENLTGLAPTEIVGTIPNVLSAVQDVNMFEIYIADPAHFSVMSLSTPFGVTDTELFLFDSTGHGVYANDDMGGTNPNTFSLACLPSAVSNPCVTAQPAGVGPTSPGDYYLAISRSSDMPLSTLGEIFTLVSSTDVVGPDLTKGGPDAITGWDGGGFLDANPANVNYDILLTGTSVPEPASWVMAGIACLVLVVLRRRLNGHPLNAARIVCD